MLFPLTHHDGPRIKPVPSFSNILCLRKNRHIYVGKFKYLVRLSSGGGGGGGEGEEEEQEKKKKGEEEKKKRRRRKKMKGGEKKSPLHSSTGPIISLPFNYR